MKLTIEQTLKKDDSDFRFWFGANTAILQGICPKCKSNVVCAYADMASVDYVDVYHHICMNDACDFIEKKDEYGIGLGARDMTGPDPCPFCNRTV